MKRARILAPAALTLLATLACTGLVPLEQRLPGLCEAAVDGASLYEPQARRSSPELVAACVDWYGTWAAPEEIATLECMAGAQDTTAWRACRPEYEPPGPAWEEVPALELPMIRGKTASPEPNAIDRQLAENAGVLAALRDGTELDGVFGSTGVELDEQQAMEGLIGSGGIGSPGQGSEDSSLELQGGSAATHGAGTTVGDPIILGALDRSAIDEVIRRHMNQIRYCYEKGLTKTPSLEGKIVVKYVVAKDGTVSSSKVKSTTLNDSAVEMCVTGCFMRMQFPEPKGGGIVIVSYPFVFTPG